MPAQLPAISSVKSEDSSRDTPFALAQHRRTNSEAREAAYAVLSPVLSRAREQYKEDHVLSGSYSREMSFVPIPSIFPGQQLSYLQGGEGIRRLVESREKNQRFLGMSVEYWDISLFSFKGRAWPMLPQVLYVVYSTVMTAIVIQCVSNYKTVSQFEALQFPIQTLGLALFLLLSFRTNSSYERWWEGRKCWDGIDVGIQDGARMALGWVAPRNRQAASGIVRWLLVFAFVAKKTLRVEEDYPELAGIISEAEIDQLQDCMDPIEMTLQRLSEFVSQAHDAGTPVVIVAALDGTLRTLQTSLTACSRIMSTPMPFAYIVHLRSFMLLWLLGLPFVFVRGLGYWSILVCSVVGYELLGFETIGVEIENPFGRDYNDLPLDLITTELFVKMAGALSKLGHIVNVEPILCADPMNDADYIHKRHQSINALQSAELGKSIPSSPSENSAAQKVSNNNHAKHHDDGDGDDA